MNVKEREGEEQQETHLCHHRVYRAFNASMVSQLSVCEEHELSESLTIIISQFPDC